MASVNLPQGSYNLPIEKGVLLVIEKGVLKLTSLAKDNQESFVSASQQPNNRQFPIARQPSTHLYTSALGLAGGVGLVVSCVWSILLPAIGSVGVMAFAYLVDRRITLLHTKELPSAAIKSQDLFAKQIGNGADNTGNLPLSSTIQPKSENPALSSTKENNPNISPPPPPLPPLSLSTREDNPKTIQADLRAQIHKGKELKVVLPPTGNSMLPNGELLDSIRIGKKLKSVPNIEKMKEVMEKSSSSSLLKILQCVYERALNVSKTEENQGCEKYLEGRLKNFKDKFPLKDISAEENLELENVFKYIETSASLTESMKWIQNLLHILSNCEDLTEENKEYFFSEHAGSTQISLKKDSRSSLLLDIHTGKKLRRTLNIDKINEIIERSPPNVLLKILQSTYERALNISSEGEKNQNWINYFESKVKSFKDKVSLEESQNPDIEGICKQAKKLRSLLESMKWIQNLLCVLSKHKDLSEKDKQYYSKKLEHTKTRIKRLESGGNIVAEALLERADVMQFSDNDDSDNDDVEVNDSDWG